MVASPTPRLYLPAADWEEDLMPERGPAQLLLLLFSRPRAKLGWRIGLAAASIAMLGLLPGEESLYHQAKLEIAQSLRQAAWKHALANEPATQSWPWSDSLATYSKVPRLGLSAAVLHERTGEFLGPKPNAGEQSSVFLDGRDPHLNVGVAIGDRITVTKSDGTSQTYRVTGYELFDGQGRSGGDDAADPHYPRSESPFASVLHLIIEAVHVDALERQATSHEHKL
jgi:hypothetical protein